MNCPECDAQVAVPDDAIRGEVVSCTGCGTSYELVRAQSGRALSLQPAELEQEDWGE